MPKSSIEELVEAALDRLRPHHTEEVTHDVFETIENDPALRRDYDALCERNRTPHRFGPATVNRTIASWVKKKTGRSTLSGGHPSTRSKLIKTWSRLRCGTETATMRPEMPTLFDGTYRTDDIVEILDRMRSNCPRPSSNSGKLWKLRRRTNVTGHNPSRETLLERAVAMLANNGHLTGWFNQCPVASGIGGSARDRRRSVDLVHWNAADSRLSLVELKWGSDTPSEAVRQILRYGAAYLFCRTHRERLPVGKRRAMSATHVALRVAAPGRFYADDGFRDCLSRARESLWSISGEPGTRGLSMSLDALAFPEWFDRLPFSDGAEVRDSCDRPELTEKGRIVVEAVDGLTSVYPDRDGAKE